MERYILWLGPIFKEAAVTKYVAVNAAANNWRRGLLRGMVSKGVIVRAIGHRNERGWPFGKLWPNEQETLDPEFDQHLVPWCNLPIHRYRALGQRYEEEYESAVAKWGVPYLIMMYNPLPWNLVLARKAKRMHSVPFVCVTLDFDEVDEGWDVYRDTVGDADGHIFLSYWGYTNCPLAAPKLHFEGGVARWRDTGVKREESRPKTFLYAGKFAEYGGLQMLVDGCTRVQREDVDFVFCGRSTDPRAVRRIRAVPRSKYYGFVSDAELSRLHSEAYGFLNPRPNARRENMMAFPSKLLSYLEYGKPIVSSWTPGLSPEYEPAVFRTRDDSADAFAEQINRVADFGQSEYAATTERIGRLVLNEKLIEINIQKVVGWIAEHFGHPSSTAEIV